MDEEEFVITMKKIKGNLFELRQNQYKFYQNADIFLKDAKKDILLARGGMGLGKTISILLTIIENLDKYDHIFIATPTKRPKKEWCKALTEISEKLDNTIQKNSYTEMISKGDCCDPRFGKDKSVDCKDDVCEFLKHLKKDKIFSDDCKQIFENLRFPVNTEDWYTKNGCISCLLAPIRYGLKNTKIAIGDYYFIFNYPAFNSLIIQDTHRFKKNSLLIIDEPQNLPKRAEEFYSKELDLTYLLKQLKKKEEIYKLISDENTHIVIFKGTKGLEKLERHLIKKYQKCKKEKINILGNQMRYTYKEFKEDFEKVSTINLMDFYLNLDKASKILSKEEYETEDDPQLKRLFNFIRFWKEKYYDEDYGQYFQYSEYKNNNLKLKVSCDDLSNIIPQCLSDWKKVIMLSGTINPGFIKTIGLSDDTLMFPDELISYPIKKRILRYPFGKFTYGKLNQTADDNYNIMNEVTETMKGRILIAVKNKELGNIIAKQFGYKDVFNLCNTKNSNDFDKKIKEFSIRNNGLGILHIRGPVEGQNMKNIDDMSIENIIIYGYPYNMVNFENEDKINNLIKRYGNKQLARNLHEYIPLGQLIHQTLMRGKRSTKDNPIFILWDEAFADHRMQYHCLPDDTKGFCVPSKEDLIKKIKELQND